MFIDSDDYIENKSLIKIITEIKNSNIDVFMSDYYEVCDEKVVNTVDFSIDSSKEIRKIKEDIFKSEKCIWTAWKFIVKKKFLTKKSIKFKKGFLHEDVDYTTKILTEMESFETIKSPWYYYRIVRVGSIMSNRNIKSTVDTAKIVVDLNKELLKKDEEYYNLVLSRLSRVFFTTIRYAKKGSLSERDDLYKIIENNFFILAKSKLIKHKVFFLVAKIIGVKMAFKICSYLY